MKETRDKRISLKQWLLRTLIIMASTLAVVDLLKQHYALAIILGVSWSMLIVAEKRILKGEPKD